MKAIDHCIRYLYATKNLAIRYSNSENEELCNQAASSTEEIRLFKSNLKSLIALNDKQIFERTADAFFVNDADRKNADFSGIRQAYAN
jgi:hypothetical protein